MLTSAAAAGIAAESIGPIPVLIIAASLQTLAGPAFMTLAPRVDKSAAAEATA
jgi:hypothetical protein